MKSVVSFSLLLVGAIACFLFPDQDLEAQTARVQVSAQLWARATPPGGSSGAIYGRILNEGPGPLTLRAVKFAPAKHIMVHETVLEDGMMKMKHANVVIAAGQAVDLLPGGRHIMLMSLSSPLMEGCQYQVVLDWEDGPSTTHAVDTGGIGQSQAPGKASKTCQ